MIRENKTMERLGFKNKQRAVIFHHDDLGMNHGSNLSFHESYSLGVVRSGSVMVPCPYFPEVVEMFKNNPGMDIGVHLTLTSEWPTYRWRPLSTNKESSGLIDEQGFFWKNRLLLRQNMNIKAAECELRTQIQTVFHAGIDVSHLDCHMGSGFIPELLDVYVSLGKEFHIPIMMPRNIKEILNTFKMGEVDFYVYNKVINFLEDENYPLIDNFRITPGFDSSCSESGYKNLIDTLPEGLTYISLHPNTVDSIQHIDTKNFQWRIDEHNFFTDTSIVNYITESDIEIINFKTLKKVFNF